MLPSKSKMSKLLHLKFNLIALNKFLNKCILCMTSIFPKIRYKYKQIWKL